MLISISRRSSQWDLLRRRAELFHNFDILQSTLHQVFLQPEQLLIQIRLLLPIRINVDPLLLHIHLQQVLDHLVIWHHEVQIGQLCLVGPFNEGLQTGEESVRFSDLEQVFDDIAEILEKVLLVVFRHIDTVA